MDRGQHQPPDLSRRADEFASDDGSVPAAVADVLTRRARGEAAIAEVVEVLAAHRLLVPLLEVDADQLEGDDADPCAGQDRAVAAVSVRTPQGTVGLAFTGMGPLTRWNALARPLPVPADRVAGALLAEGGIGLVIDPGSQQTCRIEGVALQRLARGEPWPAPWQDPAVQRSVLAELGPAIASGELAVRLCAPREGSGSGLLVQLRLPIGLTQDELGRRVEVVATRLRESAALAEVFDGVLEVGLA